MALLESRDPNILFSFTIEEIAKKDDVDFYVSPESDYIFFPYRVKVDFYGTTLESKTDYVSIMKGDLETILYNLKKIKENEVKEFDIESTEGDFFISFEQVSEDEDLFWVSIDMSGMLFGQDFEKTESTAISFTFLTEKDKIEEFYNTLLKEIKNVIEHLKLNYPDEFENLSGFFDRVKREEFINYSGDF